MKPVNAARTVGQAEVDRRVREIDFSRAIDRNRCAWFETIRASSPSARAFSRSAVRRTCGCLSLAVLMDRFGLSHDPGPAFVCKGRSGRICCAKWCILLWARFNIDYRYMVVVVFFQLVTFARNVALRSFAKLVSPPGESTQVDAPDPQDHGLKEQGDHHADRYVAPEFHGESRQNCIARSTVVMIAIGAIGYLVHDKLPAQSSVALVHAYQRAKPTRSRFAAVASPELTCVWLPRLDG